MRPMNPPSRPDRRSLLLQMLAVGAALSGCGGGGGDSGGSTPTPPPPPSSAPTGSLVYRNSTAVGVYNFATKTQLQFDAGSQPFPDPGVSTSPGKLISAARDGDASSDFILAFFSLAGVVDSTYRVTRDASFQTSAVVFNAAGTRIAFSVDEPASASNSTRIARTVVANWPAGTVITEIDLHEEPFWAGNELLVRDPATLRLRLFNSSLVDQGLLGSLQVGQQYGSYCASADGRLVVYQDNSNGLRLVGYDRSTGSSWVAAQDSVSETRSPVLSPDGRYLGMLTRGVFFDLPHVLPFAVGSTVNVDSAVHEIGAALTNCGGRIGWAA